MIHHHLRGGDVSRRALGFYLRDLLERGEFKVPGHASLGEFAEKSLGMSGREARDLVRVDRALEDLRELERAFGAGEIGWSKLRELTLVAVPETELEWLAFARVSACRQVESAVQQRRRGQKPPAADGLGTPRVSFRVQYDLPVALSTLWQTALEKLMGGGLRGLDAPGRAEGDGGDGDRDGPRRQGAGAPGAGGAGLYGGLPPGSGWAGVGGG